ncbi:MAG: HK97 family phage prohead protease [Candidatus Nealsonbacteria bacterium]|nr:HK97 family phage prohead protease [Candidatus Nealsonbacteria bacterium]
MSSATLPATTEWLRANATSSSIGVDHEAGAIRGYTVAQEGPFKSEGRGEFDQDSLRAIVRLMEGNGPLGTKSRFTHPDMSNDGLGKFLGRARRPRLAYLDDRQERMCVRADLILDETALDEPVGGGKPLGRYVLDLATSDPDALSSSLVLTVDEETRLDSRGRPALDEKGNVLPPLWRPKAIHASDIVDTGDAVGALLSTDNLPDAIVRKASELLDAQFAGCSREVVEARCTAYFARYLSRRFGPAKPGRDLAAEDEARRARQRRRSAMLAPKLIARLSGVAAVYWTALRGYQPNLTPEGVPAHFQAGCFRSVLSSGRTVAALIEHDWGRKVGNTDTNLRLSADGEGLLYSLDLFDSPTSRKLLQDVTDGTVRGMSIGWGEATSDETLARNFVHGTAEHLLVHQADLQEITFTSTPACKSTTIEVRR